MNKTEKQLFIDRLTKLLANRKKTPWGLSKGFKAGTVARMFDPEKPLPAGAEMRVIARSEQVSLSWLYEAKGPMFMVHSVQTATEFSEDFSTYESEDYERIDVLSAGEGSTSRGVVIFSTPCESEYKNEVTYQYLAMEVTVGPFSPKLKHQLDSTSLDVHYWTVSPSTIQQFDRGDLGTYAIEQLLLNAEQSDSESAFRFIEMDAASNKHLRMAIEMVEEAIAEDGAQLSAAQKAKVVAAIYEHLLEDDGDLTPKTIRLMIGAAA